jgi:hypothetical protein
MKAANIPTTTKVITKASDRTRFLLPTFMFFNLLRDCSDGLLETATGPPVSGRQHDPVSNLPILPGCRRWPTITA